jgi:hypothetical protein
MNLKLIAYALFFSIAAFLILSIPTAVMPNKFFVRMTPVYWFDYIFLVIDSMLIGMYYTVIYSSSSERVCNLEKKSIAAQTLSFLGLACPTCVKFLVLIFGTMFLLRFLEPIRPFISLAAFLWLAWLVYHKLKLFHLENSYKKINY